MDKSELSDEEYKKRKAEAIAKQQKKHFSDIFVLCASLFLIVETLVILIVLMLPIIAIFSYVFPKFGTSTGVSAIFGFVIMVAFFGGLLLGFFILRKTTNYIIRKKHWEDKLTKNVRSRYMKKTKAEKEMELKR